jgi:hypothetical protein
LGRRKFWVIAAAGQGSHPPRECKKPTKKIVSAFDNLQKSDTFEVGGERRFS